MVLAAALVAPCLAIMVVWARSWGANLAIWSVAA
jgi:hypothetical protein